MDKYGLSVTGLQKAISKLVDSGTIRREELFDPNPLREDTVDIDFDTLSLSPDNELVCIIPICDAVHHDCCGALCEIGENGLQVSGIRTAVGETRSFLIDPSDFFAVGKFRLEAKCLWCKESPVDQSPVAGFEISGILFEDLENLRELVQRLRA
jgi:hypothetical protein